jgi:Ca2+-binding RTX toxin-like protein
VIEQAPGINRLLSTGGVTRVFATDPFFAANDQIYGGSGSAIVIAGNGNDLINLVYASGGAPNLVLADDGAVVFANPEYFTSLGGWFADLAQVIAQDPHYGGSDRVLTGSGPALIIGGAGSNFIKTRGGAVIIGNEGNVTFSGGHIAQVLSTYPSVSGHDPLAGNTIITGPGNSQIIGGSGNNTIRVGAGESVVIAANGEIDYNAAGQPVAARGLYPSFGGTDRITIAGHGGAPGSKGVVILGPGKNVVKAPAGYLRVPARGRATKTGKHHRWVNPRKGSHHKPTKHKHPATHKKHKGGSKHAGKPGATHRHRVHQTK